MDPDQYKPGMAFRFKPLPEGIYVYAFQSAVNEKEALFRKFNPAGLFIEPVWFRIPTSSQFITRAGEFDIV